MDRRLVIKAQRGNWQAFLKLALAHRNQLYHKALLLLRNPDDAADAVQEALFRAFTALPTLKEPGYFQTWLFRILINTCTDTLRKQSKTVHLPLNREPAAPSHADAVSARLDLQSQLDRLNPSQRTVLVLRYYEDMKVEDIALALDLSPGTVKSRIHYGLKQLKKQIKEERAHEM